MTGVRGAGAADVEALLRVQGECVGAPVWSEGVWRRLLAGKGVVRVVLVAEREAGVVGFVVVSCAVGVAEVESVAVLPAVRRQGVGRELCVAAMEWARVQGAQRMELEVRDSSAAPLGLYRALGFVEQGRRAGYYRDPVEDALLLTAALGDGSRAG
jgi:ribosomal protein S18 acetylase RimI-like enzyme